MINFTTQYIIWQPFANCERQCKGCYVRASKHTKHRAFAHWTILASLCHGSLKATEELVVSIDSKEQYSRQEKALLTQILALPQVSPDTNLHLAVRDFGVLSKVMTEMRLIGSDFRNKNLNTISVSEIYKNNWINLPIDVAKAFWDFSAGGQATLNWNYLVDPSQPLAYHQEQLWEYVLEVDTLHLILMKPSLCKSFDIKSFERYWEMLDWCRRQPHINDKLYVDICYSKHLDSLHSPQDCSPYRQIHIWPSGDITICPYDSCGVSTAWRHNLEFIQQFDYIDKDDPFGLHCELNEWRNCDGE